jgi:hypothetical protein
MVILSEQSQVQHRSEAEARPVEDRSAGLFTSSPIEVSGVWVDRVVGLEGVRAELIIVAAPDGSGRLELTAFHEPTRAQDQAELPANAHGYRHIAYRVTNIDAVVAQTRAAGDHTVGDVVDYQDSYRLASIRGPKG